MNLIRLKRLWNLSRKEPEELKRLQGLTDEQLDLIPNENYDKAVFITEATEEDLKEYEKEQKGLKGIFGT